MRKAAFTLIELLVVISIIAILAAIAIPVFSAAQEKARATQDAANLKNLGIGINAYLNDNEDQMFSKAATESWPIVLHKKYVTDWKVFRSPFDKESAARPSKDKAPGVPISYGINTNLYDIHASKFASPSELIMAAAAVKSGSKALSFDGLSETNVTLDLPSGAKAGTHSNKNLINVLCADTHVTPMLWKDYSQTSTEAGLRRWYPEGQPAQQQP